MTFEWDENKNQINIKKHGLSFEEATKIFEISNIILEAKTIENEKRYAIIGKLKDKCYFCVFTIRNGKIRIISARRCRKKEEEYYESRRV